MQGKPQNEHKNTEFVSEMQRKPKIGRVYRRQDIKTAELRIPEAIRTMINLTRQEKHSPFAALKKRKKTAHCCSFRSDSIRALVFIIMVLFENFANGERFSDFLAERYIRVFDGIVGDKIHLINIRLSVLIKILFVN